MPAFLARYADPDQSLPIARGVWVRESLLCQHLPEPPADVDPLPEVDPNLTTAERFALHSSIPACSGCHQLIDPIGLGFEHYDAIGRWRTEEGNARAVDAAGNVSALGRGTVELNGAPQLAQTLLVTQEVHECLAQQWFHYTMSRPNSEADACGMEQALWHFKTVT